MTDDDYEDFDLECDVCGGTGETEAGELYEMDPLWYDPDDVELCSACGGRGCFDSGLGAP